MGNTSKKGTGIERTAKQILEQQGYVVHRTVRTPVVRGGRVIGSNANDVFGCFDLIGRSNMGHRYVQTTVSGKVREKQRDVVKEIGADWPIFAWRELADLTTVITREVWGWYGGRRTKDKDGNTSRAQCFRVTRLNAQGVWEELPDVELLPDMTVPVET